MSIDVDVIAQLKKRTADTMIPQSRLVEQGLRLLLALPLPEREEEGEGSGVPTTRTMREVLRVLEGLGPGWHTTGAIAREVGASPAVTRHALQTLKREGKAFLWGEGTRNFEGQRCLCWGVRPGLEVARAALRGWIDKHPDPMNTAHVATLLQFMPLIRKLALGMGDDAKVISREVAGAFGFASRDADIGIDCQADADAKRIRRADEAREKLKAEYQADVKAQRLQMEAEQSAARKYDAEAAPEDVAPAVEPLPHDGLFRDPEPDPIPDSEVKP
jgi:hypothetical protein